MNSPTYPILHVKSHNTTCSKGHSLLPPATIPATTSAAPLPTATPLIITSNLPIARTVELPSSPIAAPLPIGLLRILIVKVAPVVLDDTTDGLESQGFVYEEPTDGYWKQKN
jgi:hypothetical protein